MPVLAKKAVEGTGLIENSQVFITILGTRTIGKTGITCPYTPRADPVGHTVGREGVIIPVYIGFIRGHPFKSTPLIPADPAVTPSPLGNLALISADITQDPFRVSRWG